MKITAEQMDDECNEIFLRFQIRAQAIRDELQAELESLGKKVDASDIPGHIAEASFAKLIKRMDGIE